MLIPSDPVNAFVDYDDTPVPNAGDGPLAGLTFAVKDIFDVAGYPTGCGNPERRAEGGVASEDAPAVKVLLDAGARTEPPVSLPSAISARPAATADAEPEEEPPGTRSGAAGLIGVP